MDSSSGCDATDWLLLADTDGVLLTARPRLREALLREDFADSAFKSGLPLTEMDFEVPRAKDPERCGGLTGSKAGDSGSSIIGPGVDGVDCDAHLVPKPRVSATGLVGAGVCGTEDDAAARLACPGVPAACRIMCSGIAG